jgi:hypothetical protein
MESGDERVRPVPSSALATRAAVLRGAITGLTVPVWIVLGATSSGTATRVIAYLAAALAAAAAAATFWVLRKKSRDAPRS